MTSQFLIYALVDPRTGKRFYVGQSFKGMARPRQHMKPTGLKGPTMKAAYLRSLVALGLSPEIEVLEYIADPDVAIPPPIHCWQWDDVDALDAREMWWITHGNNAGWPLTNRTTGGDGARGMVVTDAHRANMSKAALGKKKAPFTAEQRANMSRAAKGKKKSPEHVAKMAASKRGVKQTPQHRANIAAAHTGKMFTAERRARISAAVRNSPKAIEQRAKLHKLKIGMKRPPMSPETAERFKRLGESRRGIRLGHGDKIRATKAMTRIGRHFALLLAGLATIR